MPDKPNMGEFPVVELSNAVVAGLELVTLGVFGAAFTLALLSLARLLERRTFGPTPVKQATPAPDFSDFAYSLARLQRVLEAEQRIQAARPAPHENQLRTVTGSTIEEARYHGRPERITGR